MPKRTTDYRSTLLEDLKDPIEAQNYLSAALEDSEDMFLTALRDVAEAHQMAKVAGKVGVSRESLYRMLTASGNPTYRNFFGILRALDVAFAGVRAKTRPQLQPPTPPMSHVRRRRGAVESRTTHAANEVPSAKVGARRPVDMNPRAPFRRIENVGVEGLGLGGTKVNIQPAIAQRGQQQIAAKAAA